MIAQSKRLLFALVCLMALLVTSPRLLLAQDDVSSARVHTVAWGDTLFAIANQYGVTVADLVAANNLIQSDLIMAGQRLVIPGGSPSASGTAIEHTVQPGENLFRISVQYGVSLGELLALNSLSSPDQLLAGQTLRIGGSPAATAPSAPAAPAQPADGAHIVQAGETLFGIATRYGVSLSSLSNANNLLNVSAIYVGQRLAIPGAATANTPGYTPAASGRTYTVVAGDTLHSIALQNNTSVAVLSQINQISNPSALYVGQALTLPDAAALTPSSGVAGSARSIIVDVSEQRTYLYENGALIATFVSSTGQPGSDTFRGNFAIQNKIPNAYAATWNLQMPHWLGFYWAGPLQNGFHALPILSNGVRLWEGYLGTPISYGCVVLGVRDAERLYNWAEVGTPVTVRD